MLKATVENNERRRGERTFSFNHIENPVADSEQSVENDVSAETHGQASPQRESAFSIPTPSSKSSVSITVDADPVVDKEGRVLVQLVTKCEDIATNDTELAARPTSQKEKLILKVFYLGVVAVVVLMLNAEQNLLAPSLSQIALEFNFTDQEKDLFLGGYLSIAYFAFGGVAAIAAGFAADVSNRRISFTLIVLIGEISCLCTIFVSSFWGLFITRLFAGISLGGSYPILFSMIGDTFVDEWRGRASGLLQIVSGGGVLVGQTIAALVSPTLGWRAPFVIVSVPAILFTLIFFVLASEPKRGTQERVLKTMVEESVIDERQIESYSGKISWRKFCLLLQSKTVVLLLILCIPTNLPWGFLLVYAQDFLMNDIGKTIPGGISSSESLLVVIIFSLSSAVGSILGGILTDILWVRNPVWVSWFAALTTLAGATPMFFVANVQMPYFGYCLLVVPSGFLVTIAGITKNAMLLNCTLPETRGTAFALNTLVDDLGKGLGSFLIAMMIVGLGGRIPAFNVAFGGWILAAAMFALTSYTLKRDLRAKNQRLVASVTEPNLAQRPEDTVSNSITLEAEYKRNGDSTV